MRRILLIGALFLAACGGGTTDPSSGNPVASITLTPATGQVQTQHTLQLTPTLKDADGTTLTGKTVTWSAAPSGLVTISGAGLVTGVTPGVATVTASSGGKNATASITVTSTDIAQIGATGGVVTAASGKVVLTFPAGAVSGNTSISVSPMVNPPTNPRTVATTAYEFGPSGTFAEQVQVAIKYDPATLPSGVDQTALRLYTLVGNTWTYSPNSSVNVTTHTVTGFTKHFSGWITCAYPCDIDQPTAEVGTNGFTSVSIKSGAIATLQGAIWRANGYSGAVNITMEGAPTGLTMAIVQGQYPDTPIFSFTATSAVAPGRYAVNIVGRGSGIPDSRFEIIVVVTAPGYSYTVTPTSIPVTQGLTATANIAITRDGANGNIAFTALNLPNGVTASFAPQSVSGTSTIMTLTAAAGAGTGAFNSVIVKGSGAGVADVQVPISITVISSSGFSVIGTPPLVSLNPGGTGSTGVKAIRAVGFSGAITWNVTGLVNGLTAVVTSTAVADSMKVTFTATAGLAVGNYNVAVTGTSGAKTEMTSLLVTVGNPGSVTIQLNLAPCLTGGRTLWVAAQDGSGPFAVVNGNAGLYAFPVTSGKGAFVAVITDGSQHTTFVEYGTPTELSQMSLCGTGNSAPRTKLINFSVIGLQPFDRFDVSMGGTVFPNSAATPEGDFIDMPEGPLDFVVLRYQLPTPTNVRGFIRRNQTIPHNGTAAPFDMNGPESFAAVPGTASAPGGTLSMGYLTGGGCTNYAGLGTQLPAGTVYGVPASAQQPADVHVLQAGLAVGSNGFQFSRKYFHTMANQVLSYGAAVPSVIPQTLAGPYRRLQVGFTLPGDYTFASYGYAVGPNTVYLQGQLGAFPGGVMSLSLPDLSALAGVSTSWFPATTGSLSSYFQAQSAVVDPCTDGTSYKASVQMSSN